MGSTDERKGKERPEQDIVTFPETAEVESLPSFRPGHHVVDDESSHQPSTMESCVAIKATSNAAQCLIKRGMSNGWMANNTEP